MSVVSHKDVVTIGLPGMAETGRIALSALREWDLSPAAPAGDVCIHTLFESQVWRTPHAVAAVCESDEWTYDLLNRRANQVAHRLLRLGVGPETMVGVCMERSLEVLAAILGVLEAGGAYIPMDPVYPRDRLAFMLADARARTADADAAARSIARLRRGRRLPRRGLAGS